MKAKQKEVDDWIKLHKAGYFKPLEIMTHITEEVGELARELNHLYGQKKKKDSEDIKELADEISDVMFILICLANSHGIDLDESFSRVMDKCYGRDKDRYKKK
ncbi:nucleotide pyrophosphohydrolase [Candidatus Wolfebacteria bacterium]|nr:MAG: nucleotide pyrophosphohydrolase [Candidatus Wolfebacteria bacterium]